MFSFNEGAFEIHDLYGALIILHDVLSYAVYNFIMWNCYF